MRIRTGATFEVLAHGLHARAWRRDKAPPAAKPPGAAEFIKFSGFKALEEIVLLDAMPLNATGKVDRANLKVIAAGDYSQVL